MSAAARFRKQIFAGCKTLGLDDDARRDLVQLATGKPSMKGMTAADLELVVGVLRQRGFKASSGKKHKLASRGDLRFVHRLWTLLGEADALNKPGRDGLNAFIRKSFGKSWGSVPADVDMLRDHTQIAAVIEALKAMCHRHGIETEIPK